MQTPIGGSFAGEPFTTALFDLSSDELDRYPVGVITLSREGRIVRYNRAEAKLSRLEPHTVIGRLFFGDVAPCAAVKEFQGRFEVFAAGTTSSVERFDWVFMFRWGRQDVTVTLLRRENRPEIHLIVSIRSTSAPIPMAVLDTIVAPGGERPSRNSHGLETEVGIWADDPIAGTAYRSDELHRILAAGPELETHADPIVRYAHPKHAEALASEMRLAYDQGRSYLLRTLIVSGDGNEKDVLVHGAFFHNGQQGKRSIGSVVDLTQRRTVEDQLWESAHLDPLTLLPNRRLLLERLTALVAADEVGLAVCFIDLDKFKRANDSAGHAVGDLLLRLVAERIGRVTRPTDIVARINGDEFVVVLLNIAQPAAVDSLLGRILDSVSEPYTIEGKQHVISASAGIATHPADGRTADELLSAADAAMYRAKASGAGAFRRYTPEMRESAVQNRERANELALALERYEIQPHFQAIVDGRTGSVVGAEALARWNHPTLGTLAPLHFIALAEASGAIHQLGDHMLREACAWGKRWHDVLGAAAPFVSVNVSGLQFQDRRFAGAVRAALERTGLPPHLLELELTESIVIDRFEETMLALAELKMLGVRLSIDDFGTGYSALAYLKFFPIDTVKLDRAFVEGIGIDTLDDSIVETIVTLARKLHLHVIAEGVETVLQAERLAELGCDLMQGFYFGRPIAPERFTEHLLTGGGSIAGPNPA